MFYGKMKSTGKLLGSHTVDYIKTDHHIKERGQVIYLRQNDVITPCVVWSTFCQEGMSSFSSEVEGDYFNEII